MFKKDIMDYIGDISQIGGAKRYTLNSGKAKGVEAVDIDNGSGLLYTIVLDRGMDIYHLKYKGIPISFISKTGIVSPYFYNDKGYEWLRGFTGGFLTTCGLNHVGDPCTFNGGEYGLHGRYSNLPADNVSVVSEWCGKEYVIKVSGTVSQAMVLYENIILRRSIRTNLYRDEIIIEDFITNEGINREPFMILYHMNFGYPFLNPESDIVIPAKSIKGWDEFSEENAGRHLQVTEPELFDRESTYYHDLNCDKDGVTGFFIV